MGYNKVNQNSMNTHIHFIGIGGIGMSALARFWHHEGAVVTGSDRARSIVTEGLEAIGVTIFYEQTALNIGKDSSSLPNLVVYTEAMAHDHPEMLAAREQGIRMINYFEALGEVANEYYLIAVAGAHGKTTTTAMLIDILEAAGLDPTGIVGSLRSKTKSNFRAGKSKFAVVEACEYKRDFLHLNPNILVITNVEWEHVDYYKDLADVQDAFRELVAKVPANGYVIADISDANIQPIIRDCVSTVIDYRRYIDVLLHLRQPGIHNRMNAAAATAAANCLTISAEVTKTALEDFAGTWRRFEYKGEILPIGGGSVPVYDDYGHHPTELRATFRGMRELYPQKRLVVVFQSHTYSRTSALFDEFVDALSEADITYLLPIYSAREVNTFGVSSEQMVESLHERGVAATLLETSSAVAVHVKEIVRDNDVVLVIGAGAVTEVAELLTKSY
jgi:UDP-N-acetylmuramate--alanine ligase